MGHDSKVKMVIDSVVFHSRLEAQGDLVIILLSVL